MFVSNILIGIPFAKQKGEDNSILSELNKENLDKIKLLDEIVNTSAYEFDKNLLNGLETNKGSLLILPIDISDSAVVNYVNAKNSFLSHIRSDNKEKVFEMIENVSNSILFSCKMGISHTKNEDLYKLENTFNAANDYILLCLNLVKKKLILNKQIELRKLLQLEIEHYLSLGNELNEFLQAT